MKKFLERIFLNEHIILILIFLNAVLIFIQDFDNIPIFVTYLDNFFTAVFTIEMMVKVNHYGFRKYWQNGWNKMDFILIMIALVSVLIDLVDIRLNIPLNYVLVLRSLRLLKSFRIFRFMPDINNIIKGLNRAVKASYVITFTFMLLLVIISVLSCSIFKTTAPEYFETPLESLYSIFRLFTAEGWYEISDLIASRSSPAMAIFTKVYFVVLMFIAGILGVSLINSIFVDAMVSSTSDRLEEKVDYLSRQLDVLMAKNKKKRTKSGSAEKESGPGDLFIDE
ncbi:MAG: ion transporter [Tannerellaceae bacterium]|nr:ion transporter [Tannerellaceae bacterium]